MLSLSALRSLARAVTHPTRLFGRRIGPKLREQIILRVSAINRCVVCSAVHRAVARAHGLDATELSSDGGGGEDAAVAAALRYAEIRTSGLEQDFPQDVHAFERAFGAEEQAEIRAIVDLFTFNNRINNTWEAWLPGSGWRRKRLGI